MEGYSLRGQCQSQTASFGVQQRKLKFEPVRNSSKSTPRDWSLSTATNHMVITETRNPPNLRTGRFRGPVTIAAVFDCELHVLIPNTPLGTDLPPNVGEAVRASLQQFVKHMPMRHGFGGNNLRPMRAYQVNHTKRIRHDLLARINLQAPRAVH